jgi:putative DNA primase/helicase
MIQAGQTPPKSIIADGVIHRYPVENGTGKIHGKSGWYCFHTDGPVPVGFFGDWRKGTSVKWVSDEYSNLGYLDQMQATAFMAQAEINRKNQQDAEYARAAESAKEIYAASKSPTEHAYLIKKNIAAYPGVKQAGNSLVIPVLSESFQVQSLQYIRPSGDKKNLPKGKMKGGFFIIQGSSTILICEGYATGATLHRCTGHTVYCAFSAGNILSVAQIVKSKNLESTIIICGDNDIKKQDNIGATKATIAGEVISAKVFLPETSGSDFNDLANESGDNAVLKMFTELKHTVLSIITPTSIEKFDRCSIKPIPAILLNPGGILQETLDYMDKMCPVSVPIFNLGCSLALLGAVGGHKICGPTGIRTNLYCLLLGHSGSGKDGAPAIVKQILSDTPDLMHFMGGSKFTGGAAIYSAISLIPDKYSKIFFLDEFAKILKRERAKNNTAETVGSAFLELYSGASGEKSYADASNNKKYPWQHVSMIGSATPDDLWAQITPTDLQDGFIARLQVFESHHDPVSAGYEMPMYYENKPRQLIKKLIEIANIEMQFDSDCVGNIETNAPTMKKYVPFKLTRTGEALEYLKYWDAEINKKQCLFKGKWQGYIYNRARETGEKYAHEHHLSKFGKRCISLPLGIDSYQYGLSLIDFLDEHILSMAGNYVSENDWHAMEQKVIRAIKGKATPSKPGVSSAVLFGQLVRIPERDRKHLLTGLLSTGQLYTKKHKGKAGPETDILCLSQLTDEE